MSRVLVAASRFEGSPVSVRVAPETAADEAMLVAAAGSGDRAAFRKLMDRHLGTIVSIGRRMLRDDAEAEDVAQEAFLRLWRSGPSLEIGPSGVRPWLRRVVSNLCLDRVRSKSRVTIVDEVPEIPEAATQQRALEADETQARVGAALQRLPERQRLALTLFHFEGMSQIEIGNVMGISDEAVESLLARARRQLKTDLKTEWESLCDDEH